jgi:hypothetical protein
MWRAPPSQRVTLRPGKEKPVKDTPKDTPRAYKVIVNPNVPPIYSTRWIEPILVEAGFNDVARFSFEPSPMVKWRIQANDSQSITTNNLGGWYAAQLIQAYCELSPYVLRPLAHLLKYWIKAHGLNREGAKVLACHAVVLMAIAYLQHAGVLPNIQAGTLAPSSDPRDESLEDTIWVNWGWEQGMVAHIAFERRAPPGWTPRKMTAAEAVRGYFKFLADFDFTTHFLSVLHGGVVPRRCPPKSE